MVPGQAFNFSVITIPAAPKDLPITITATDGASNSLTVSPVTIKQGSSAAVGQVTTMNGDVSTLDKAVVTITDHADYSLGTPHSIEVDYLEISPKPELEIVGPTSALVEGDIINYTINASTMTNVDLRIEVFVQDLANRGTSDFLSTREGADFVNNLTYYLVIPAGQNQCIIFGTYR